MLRLIVTCFIIFVLSVCISLEIQDKHEDFMESLIDIREYDVPYAVQVFLYFYICTLYICLYDTYIYIYI